MIREVPAGGCYVYGVVRAGAPLSLDAIGIDERHPRVYGLRSGGIAAVVSDVSLERLDPTRANVMAHERVNGAVLRDRTLIPMSFGTVCRTPDHVVELLRSGHDAFDEALARMDGKVELGLKVHGVAVRPEEDVAAIVERLGTVSTASRLCATLDEGMLMNAAFLVGRGREEAFDRRVREIAARHAQWRFRWSGPWPPYNFVQIRLGVEGADSPAAPPAP